MAPVLTEASSDKISFDRNAVEAKYAEERQKRLRPEAEKQYKILIGDEEPTDPFVPVKERGPVTDHVTYTHVGGGFGGLTAAVRLVEKGITDVRILDKGGDFGGTWHWNRFPGAMCDTASIVYIPLLEETGHMPTQKYAFGYEIREQCQRIGKKFGLCEKALFHTACTGLTWDSETSVWIVETSRGDRFTSTFVGVTLGPFPFPKLPGIPGLDLYKGHSFHTARWEYEFTGGSQEGEPMDKLRDKVVGIVGTGATAIQVVPELAKTCKDLYVFQRTPTSVDVRDNGKIDPDWFKSISSDPGWQRKWIMNFAANESRFYPDEDWVKDGWTDIGRRILAKVANIAPELRSRQVMEDAYDEADFERMVTIRNRVDKVVHNKETADKLKAWYRQFCKRPGFHDQYLQSFNLPNVHLVDTDGKGVEAATEAGLVANGKEYKLDLIVWASGFLTSAPPLFPLKGKDGLSILQAWEGGKLRTLHGIHTHGFPNLFFSSMMQGAALGSNVPTNSNEAAATIAAIVKYMVDNGLKSCDVTKEAMDRWVDMIVRDGWIPHKTMGSNSCSPGYYNNEGKADTEINKYYRGYPEGPVAFFNYLEDWRTSGGFKGLEFK